MCQCYAPGTISQHQLKDAIWKVLLKNTITSTCQRNLKESTTTKSSFHYRNLDQTSLSKPHIISCGRLHCPMTDYCNELSSRISSPLDSTTITVEGSTVEQKTSCQTASSAMLTLKQGSTCSSSALYLMW